MCHEIPPYDITEKELKTIWLAYIQWAISDGFFVESKDVFVRGFNEESNVSIKNGSFNLY